ncbi:acetyl-CoA carboxylase biotin carboxyl carrier protein [Actinopolyspora biskrensis]|uniref:Acetyl-CoA carboxylase biotin carboxyl carrier protein n=1 Tax=Actinopolyspora biskrensis TaxID=1470178 RepID=A0A852YVG2_9ACTN|nr:biotin/lipoyl-containing protein [Actinopolyspora biskrensis]NYH77712.1 acetyl-CoA carboxylase biotin carboxyl carrier protein [Actinopolyspora biskrensis]
MTNGKRNTEQEYELSNDTNHSEVVSLVRSVLTTFENSSCDELHLRTALFELELHRGSGAEHPRTNPAQIPPAESDRVEVRAPLVGVFRSRPSPGERPFVECEDPVKTDTRVGLIEAMKTFTPVTAGCEGRIDEVHATDGQVVEYEEKLMTVVPEELSGKET